MKPSQDIHYQSTELHPGVRLHTAAAQRFKTALLSVSFLTPLTMETSACHSLLCDVLTRGTERYPTMKELNRAQEDLFALNIGAYSRLRGELQFVRFDISCLEDAFAAEPSLLRKGTDLLKEILFRPLLKDGVFRPDITELEKKNMCNVIRSRIDDKDHYAYLRCIAAMCPSEPYSVTARLTPETVAAITPEQLTSCYRSLLDPSPVEIIYVGRKEHAEILSLCKDFPLGPRGSVALPRQTSVHPGDVRVIREPAEITQSKIVMGFRVNGISTQKDRLAFGLFHELFSASPSSRLFRNIREKDGLCYYCSGTPDLSKGVYFIASATRPGQEDALRASVLQEWRSVCDHSVTPEELEQAKLSLSLSFREITDSTYGIARFTLRRALRPGSLSPEECIRLMQTLTTEEVVAAAKLLEPDTIFVLEGDADHHE